MLIKPIDKAEEKPKQLSSLAWVKIILLIIGIAVGSFMASHAAEVRLKTPIASQEKKPELSIIDPKDLEKTKKEVAKLTEKKTKEWGGIVLGEATKQIMPIASKSAEYVADYVYKNTVEEVIKRLVEFLPERRQEVVEDWLKKETK